MTETPTTEHHAETSAKIYFVIFAALAVFTAVSFLVNEGERTKRPDGSPIIDRYTGFALILAVAICKAVLVAMFFMHLKLDWGRLYFVIIPVMLLATMMVIVLLPDIVLGWRQVKGDEESRLIFPASPQPGKVFGAEDKRFS